MNTALTILIITLVVLLSPYALRNGLATLASIAYPLAVILEKIESAFYRLKTKREKKKADKYGLGLWEYRRAKEDGTLKKPD